MSTYSHTHAIYKTAHPITDKLTTHNIKVGNKNGWMVFRISHLNPKKYVSLYNNNKNISIYNLS